MTKAELEKEIMQILELIALNKGNSTEVEFWYKILRETTKEYYSAVL